MSYPRMYTVRQRFDVTSIDDLAGEVRRQLARVDWQGEIRPGQRVAVAVGSRGLHHLETLVSTVIDYLRSLQLQPFIMPAMGSHGGATNEGQAEVLEELGITESSMGAPVVSNIDVVSCGKLASGLEVFCAKDALEADHLVAINRVKPHTGFRGEVESGLCKMLVVGCGKRKGAEGIHRSGLSEFLVPAARLIIDQAPVLCGLATVENPLGGIHQIRLALPDEFVDVDRELLKLAWELLPRIPFDELDVLIIDEMGKNISGAGMDPNVIGFWRREGGPREPDYRTVVVLDLTPQSHGNATGIGMADLTTRRLVDRIDTHATYTNALTSGIFRSARLPIVMDDDRAAVEAALSQTLDSEQSRTVRIVNTLSLETFWASEALLPELRGREEVVVSDTPLSFEFTQEGRLLPFSR